jgi:hypothetical protein
LDALLEDDWKCRCLVRCGGFGARHWLLWEAGSRMRCGGASDEEEKVRRIWGVQEKASRQFRWGFGRCLEIWEFDEVRRNSLQGLASSFPASRLPPVGLRSAVASPSECFHHSSRSIHPLFKPLFSSTHRGTADCFFRSFLSLVLDCKATSAHRDLHCLDFNTPHMST